MSKRSLFILASIFSTVTLYGIVWSNINLSVGSAILWGYLGWLLLSCILFLIVAKSDFMFPEHIIFSLFILLYGVGELLVVIYVVEKVSFVYIAVCLFLLILVKYVLFLTLNIINAATVRTVPLLKAAQKVLIVLLLINAMMWAYFTIIGISTIELAAWVWGLYALLLTVAYLYVAHIQVVETFRAVQKVPIREAGIVAVVQLCMVLMTSAWNVPIVVRTLYWSISLVLFVVIIQGKMTRSLTKRGLRELILLTVVLFLMFFISGLR